MKAILSIAGLIFELIAGFLLSIPMIWNIDGLIEWLEKASTKFDVFKKYTQKPIAVVSVLLLILYFGEIFYVNYFMPDKEVLKDAALKGKTIPVNIPYLEQSLYVIGAILLLLVLLYIPTLAANNFLRLMKWVKAGRRERQVGIIGLIVLSIGFILQGIINFLP